VFSLVILHIFIIARAICVLAVFTVMPRSSAISLWLFSSKRACINISLHFGGNICSETSYGGDDLKYYYDRPALYNDIHGLGAIFLAGLDVALLLG